MGPIRRYASGVIKEGKRVRWPKRDELFTSILVVVIIAIIAGLILFLWDWLGNTIIQAINNSFQQIVPVVEEVAEEAEGAVG
ncbi:MAG: preprotein translocase subunit SecE [Coprobacillus sp.]|nr:preprotein translocase subunit SecE [Coprobacillus sp.]